MPWTIPRLRAAPSLVWNWGLYALRPTAFATQVVTFPLVRGPYPSYAGGHGTDDLSLFPKVKQWLDYLGFMTMDKLAGYDVQTTEGAEQGIGMQIAAMAAHIAQTTCNRDIYLLFQVPAYGYDLTDAGKFIVLVSKAKLLWTAAFRTRWLFCVCADRRRRFAQGGFLCKSNISLCDLQTHSADV